MYIIGVTGGIACGKTVVSREIKKYGAKIISADYLAHFLSEPGRPIHAAYVKHYGSYILKDDGSLNRPMLANIVFYDKIEKDWVDSTMHPIIFNCVRDLLVDYQARGVPIAVLDVPLLFEAGWDILADEVWVVWMRKSKQVIRLKYRNALTQREALARINSQMDVDEKRARADVVINNSKTREMTYRQVREVMMKKFPHLVAQYDNSVQIIRKRYDPKNRKPFDPNATLDQIKQSDQFDVVINPKNFGDAD